MTYQITTQKELRKLFWEQNPGLERKKTKGGDYVADTRIAFCDFIDAMQRSGTISEALADRATL